MEKLVVYFSKTGNTKKVAQKIAKRIGADIDEIIDKDKRGEEGIMKKDIEIEYKKDPSKYGLVVIGSPVWAFNIPPFTKAYLERNSFKKVAFFCTFGLFTGFLIGRMRRLSAKPVATLKVHMKLIDKSDDKIEAFCNRLK